MTTLSKIKYKFTEKLSKSGQHEVVYSWKLKEKLKCHFKDELAFIEQSGSSDVVYSAIITVRDALIKASELQKLCKMNVRSKTLVKAHNGFP